MLTIRPRPANSPTFWLSLATVSVVTHLVLLVLWQINNPQGLPQGSEQDAVAIELIDPDTLDATSPSNAGLPTLQSAQSQPFSTSTPRSGNAPGASPRNNADPATSARRTTPNAQITPRPDTTQPSRVTRLPNSSPTPSVPPRSTQPSPVQSPPSVPPTPSAPPPGRLPSLPEASTPTPSPLVSPSPNPSAPTDSTPGASPSPNSETLPLPSPPETIATQPSPQSPSGETSSPGLPGSRVGVEPNPPAARGVSVRLNVLSIDQLPSTFRDVSSPPQPERNQRTLMPNDLGCEVLPDSFESYGQRVRVQIVVDNGTGNVESAIPLPDDRNQPISPEYADLVSCLVKQWRFLPGTENDPPKRKAIVEVVLQPG